jgi:dienelactone hydrolase
MIRPLVALVLLFTLSPALTFAADQIGPWDIKALKAVGVKPEWGKGVGKAKEVFYPGEPYKGKPTRVFAYYAEPQFGRGPYPAVLLVHGGGGKAFRAWAEHWAARGYCALAMDLSGNGPEGRLEDGGPDQSDDTKFRAFDDKSVGDMWTYHAVAAVIRGHNLLRALPEVDKDRIAVTGISWGGYLTCIVAGVDQRLKAAVPVYGCGFLHENSVWKEVRFDKEDADQRKRWVETFDPSKYLPKVTCPILFLNGTNDFAYPLDSYQKSYELVKGPRTLSVRVRLRHGHIWTFEEVDAFIDSHLKKGDPLPEIGVMKRDGASVSARVSSKTKIKGGQLHYAPAQGAWQKREWVSQPADVKDGVVSAKLPTPRPLVYYLAVTDERGLEVSAPHAIVKADEPPHRCGPIPRADSRRRRAKGFTRRVARRRCKCPRLGFYAEGVVFNSPGSACDSMRHPGSHSGNRPRSVNQHAVVNRFRYPRQSALRPRNPGWRPPSAC